VDGKEVPRGLEKVFKERSSQTREKKKKNCKKKKKKTKDNKTDAPNN
jgi:hypothetical protein